METVARRRASRAAGILALDWTGGEDLWHYEWVRRNNAADRSV
jgi:hypothetical protein